jgi:hypothetical protein
MSWQITAYRLLTEPSRHRVAVFKEYSAGLERYAELVYQTREPS